MFLMPGSRAKYRRASIAPTGAKVDFGGNNFSYVPPNPNRYRLLAFTNQVFNPNHFWTTNQPNIGSCFVAPPGARLIFLHAMIWATSGVVASGNMVIKFIKNTTIDGSGFQVTGGPGVDLFTGIGNQSDFGTGTAIMTATGVFNVNPGDYFGLFAFIDSTVLGTTTVVIDGNIAHTHCSAAVLA